ncbi:hypothetical protein Tco_0329944, partial [Tanacetum coccineum]
MERAPITRPLPTTYLVPLMEIYKSYNGGTDEEFMDDDFEYYMEELWKSDTLVKHIKLDHEYTSKSPA